MTIFNKDNIYNLRQSCLETKQALYLFHSQSSNPAVLETLQAALMKNKILSHDFFKNTHDKYLPDLNNLQLNLAKTESNSLEKIIQNISSDYKIFWNSHSIPTADLAETMLNFSNNQYMISPSNSHVRKMFEIGVAYTINNLLLLCDLYEEGLVAQINLEL